MLLSVRNDVIVVMETEEHVGINECGEKLNEEKDVF